MTDRQIEQMAIRVADIVIQALESKQKQWDTDLVAELQESLPTQDKEQRLLTELAEAMTALDYNQAATDVEYLTASIDFAYQIYEIEAIS